MRLIILLLTAAVFGLSETAFADSKNQLRPPAPAANKALLDHQTRFSKANIIRVQDNIYVAHGFDMSNIIFIEGPEGLW